MRKFTWTFSEMIMAFQGSLESVDSIRITEFELTKIVNPMRAQRCRVSDELPPDRAPNTVLKGGFHTRRNSSRNRARLQVKVRSHARILALPPSRPTPALRAR